MGLDNKIIIGAPWDNALDALGPVWEGIKAKVTFQPDTSNIKQVPEAKAYDPKNFTPSKIAVKGDFTQAFKSLEYYLQQAGFNKLSARWAMIMLCFESAYLTTKGYYEDNNPGNIYYFGKDKKKQGTYIKNDAGFHGYLHHYTDIPEFVTDFKSLLSKNKGLGSPIGQPTLNSFVKSLKSIGYFTANENTYLISCLRVEQNLAKRKLLPEYAVTPKEQLNKDLANIENLPSVITTESTKGINPVVLYCGMGLAGLAGLLLIKKLFK